MEDMLLLLEPILVMGTTESNNGDVSGNHGRIDGWFVKLSPYGSIQWQRCLGGAWEDRLYSIVQTTDAGFILKEFTSSVDGDVSSNHGGNDAWVVKLSASGSLQWQRCLGGSRSELGKSVIQSADGGYIFTGIADSNDGDVSGNHVNFIEAGDAWIVKLSSLGNSRLGQTHCSSVLIPKTWLFQLFN